MSLYAVEITFHADSAEEADIIAYELWRENADWYNEHHASLGDAKEADHA